MVDRDTRMRFTLELYLHYNCNKQLHIIACCNYKQHTSDVCYSVTPEVLSNHFSLNRECVLIYNACQPQTPMLQHPQYPYFLHTWYHGLLCGDDCK